MNETTVENQWTDQALLEVGIAVGITPDDVKPLMDMADACGVFGTEELLTAEDMAWDCAFGGGDRRFIRAMVLTPAPRPAGFLCFGPIAQWQDNFELLGMAVDPARQRMGIGSALLAEMERQVAALGGRRIFLETGGESQFEPARLFYEANGFVQEHRFRKQFIPKTGGVVFRKDLGEDPGQADAANSERN